MPLFQFLDQDAAGVRVLCPHAEDTDPHRGIAVHEDPSLPRPADEGVHRTAVDCCDPVRCAELRFGLTRFIALKCPHRDADQLCCLFLAESRPFPLCAIDDPRLGISFFFASFSSQILLLWRILQEFPNIEHEGICGSCKKGEKYRNLSFLTKHGPRTVIRGPLAQTNPSSLAIRYSSTANCRRVRG